MNILLDKSTFEMLSRAEHRTMDGMLHMCLPRVFIGELLADAAKEPLSGGGEPLKILADKFMGSGPPICADSGLLCRSNLFGQHISMEGIVPIDYGRTVTDSRGDRGFFVEMHPLNEAILRWANGSITQEERETAADLRGDSASMTMDEFLIPLTKRAIVMPRPKPYSLEQAVKDVDALLDRLRMQSTWVEVLMDYAGLEPEERSRIRVRLQASGNAFRMRRHAPYAFFCLRTQVLLAFCLRHRLISWQPKHFIDIRYMWYMPFCFVFSSNDYLHKKLAPLFLRRDQAFISGQELKAELNSIAETACRRQIRVQLSTPLDLEGELPHSVLLKTLRRLMRGQGRPSELTPEAVILDRLRAIEQTGS